MNIKIPNKTSKNIANEALKTPFGSLHKILINYTMQTFLQGKRELTFKTQHTNHIHSQHSFCNYKFHIYSFASPIKPALSSARTTSPTARGRGPKQMFRHQITQKGLPRYRLVYFPTMCCTAYLLFPLHFHTAKNYRRTIFIKSISDTAFPQKH